MTFPAFSPLLPLLIRHFSFSILTFSHLLPLSANYSSSLLSSLLVSICHSACECCLRIFWFGLCSRGSSSRSYGIRLISQLFE
ncbi:hypothetical protein K1719_013521 [Acacia pycnantha]|nr:hypothetical protein K1719_013521 [Acacia pycnantha]